MKLTSKLRPETENNNKKNLECGNVGLLSLSFHSKSEWEETLTQSPVFKIYRGLSLQHYQNRAETLLWAVPGREGAGLRVSAILRGLK